MQHTGRLSASFRDPSGFVFRDAQGVLLRQVNAVYGSHYDKFMTSGLYERLVAQGLLIPHSEVALERALTPGAVKVLAPEPVPFISYPYEWCFGQLRDAALLTLRIQEEAMARGMSLKDASAFNIQFRGGAPVFIDSLSFEPYEEGRPWIAYGQFCRHFLAPLALMHYGEAAMGRTIRGFIDGIPLPLAARALPWHSKLKPGLLIHLHLLARAERAQLGSTASGNSAKTTRVSRQGLLGIIDNLRSTLLGLGRKSDPTFWGDYYAHTNYSETGARAKEGLVGAFLDAIAPDTVWDLGANTGVYSELAAARGATTVAMDLDYGAVEALYQREKMSPQGVLPLVMDLSNPSPALGWAHEERASLLQRGPADCAMALALIHHLCIGNNVPLGQAADFFSRTCRQLIIEFVPKEDSMVRRMLATREDIFPDYSQSGFETAFGEYFTIEATAPVEDTLRTLYHMKNRTQP